MRRPLRRPTGRATDECRCVVAIPRRWEVELVASHDAHLLNWKTVAVQRPEDTDEVTRGGTMDEQLTGVRQSVASAEGQPDVGKLLLRDRAPGRPRCTPQDAAGDWPNRG